MASAIGFRVYQLTVAPFGDPQPIPLASSKLRKPLPAFLSKFTRKHKTVQQNSERERSWYFEERESDGEGKSRGYVHYGTFGFESNLVDTVTQVKSYRRQVTDIEEIPLFYEVWTPSKGRSAFIGFQSFQGRSCIGLVMRQLKEEFEKANPDFLLRYTKLIPTDSRGSLYSRAPVKKLRLFKRNAGGDLPDRYFGGEAPPMDMEITLSAKRKKSLGPFGEISTKIRESADGFIAHDGLEFDKVTAEIEIGGKTRPVGVFGDNGNAGVIDITGDVVRGDDGHPTFDSLSSQSQSIIGDFYAMLSGAPK